MWFRAFIPMAFLMAGCANAQTVPSIQEQREIMTTQKELIIVAAPGAKDGYYAAVADDIFDFHIAYGKAVLEHDDFLVLSDAEQYSKYANALGDAYVLMAPQADIWARDFSLSNAVAPIMFRYTAEGQGGGRRGQAGADHVQDVLADLMADAGLRFTESDLLNDGGNFVDDYAGRVVVSRKFLTDNDVSEADARAELLHYSDVTQIAFIDADEQGGLEHADGVVAFLEPGLLVMNSYPEDPDYAAQLKSDLMSGLPDVEIHEIITPYDGSDIYDEKFGSACGLYTNMLVSPDRVYLPQFGIPEDAQALAQVRALTEKQVIPVRSDQVCYMGGGVRCMSWQLRGENAERLKAWAAGPG
ncbi:MAG: agmatine deiminase family protein [Pseudomonadota bacterium]